MQKIIVDGANRQTDVSQLPKISEEVHLKAIK
jgi:hypothetical protein